MPGLISSPIFYFSYARANAEYGKSRANVREFVADLGTRVAEKMGVRADGTYFFDESSIEIGVIWSSKLADAIRTCRVAVALYSPAYFASSWCGREFQVFLDRRVDRRPASSAWPQTAGIVPALWIPCAMLPRSAAYIQYHDDTFPREYAQLGLQQLLSLGVYTDQYELSVEAIANGIVATANANMLAELAFLDLKNTPSAWNLTATVDPTSHREVSVVPMPAPSRPVRVFLCHSSTDKLAVRQLYRRLAAKDNMEPWFDEESLLAGQDWQLEIRRAVRASDAVIVCLSQASINKTGYIQREIKYALDVADEQPEGRIFMIPVKLEECEVPERLARWHWVNLFEDRGYERLLRSLTARGASLNK